MNTLAIKELLYKMADDMLIIGHRNSEWTGLGPMLEEDIAFSSMAQDKVGQSYHLYQLLEKLGESDPDTVAFMRNADQFHNCQFVELPIGEYDFSLIRQFLFDTAELVRFEMLANSSYQPLAQMATKFKGEVKYHTMHANAFLKQLGNADDATIMRMQTALDEAWPWALGIFEPSPYEKDLISDGVFGGEEVLKESWAEQVIAVLEKTKLNLPQGNDARLGGRNGEHTEHLQPLLDEMAEVFRVDPTADW